MSNIFIESEELMLKFKVPDNFENIPIKNYLRRHVGLSLTNWRKIKQTGLLQINNTPAFPHTLVKAGDTITITWHDECKIQPTALPLDIKYEDEFLLIINKPANMLVHPTNYSDNETLANAVMYYYKIKNIASGFHPVHRLDKNTSGLVVIAKLPYIQHLLAKDNVKKVSRFYWGITTGIIHPNAGVIDAPIGRHPNSIIQRIVRADGQHALTEYKTIKRLNDACLVELKLKTGRTHQIRVHLSHIGHPLLGDDLYGGSTALISRQALHAIRIVFDHPITNKTIDILSHPPADFTQTLKLLQN